MGQVAIATNRTPLFARFKKKCLCGKDLCTNIRMHHPRGNETKRLTVMMGEVVVKRHLRAMGFEPSKVDEVWEQIQQGADLRIAVCVHFHGGDFDARQSLKAQTTNPRAFERQRRTGMLAPLPCRAIEHNGDNDGAEDSPSYRLGHMYRQPRPAHLVVEYDASDVTGADDGAVPADLGDGDDDLGLDGVMGF